MLLCTCGGRFKTVKVGDIVVINDAIHSCDTKECTGCGKHIIDAADGSFCSMDESERVDKIFAGMAEKGHNIYGKIKEAL